MKAGSRLGAEGCRNFALYLKPLQRERFRYGDNDTRLWTKKKKREGRSRLGFSQQQQQQCGRINPEAKVLFRLSAGGDGQLVCPVSEGIVVRVQENVVNCFVVEFLSNYLKCFFCI